MINSVDPRQSRAFDPFDPVLTPRAKARLLKDWPGLFRHVILELMPVEEVASRFDPVIGAPTKELYSMAGLLVIKEFMVWTTAEAANAYTFHMDVHYALNLEPIAQDISERTIERYQRIFEEKELAADVMHKVTTCLIKELDLRIDRQRLDSTHVFSDMASFGRTRLMGVAIKRFLTQVKRHDPTAYEALDEDFRQRYQPGVHRLFGDTGKDRESRSRLRQQVAEDLHELVRRFAEDETHARRSTYRAMERILHEQCEIEEEKVKIKTHPGGDVMQNPSDPEATFDGHKGPGYQVQIVETCHPDNEVQLATSCIPQTAVDSDAKAIPEVMEDLQANDAMPEELLVDASYTSDENVQACAELGVELVGPTKDGAKDAGASEQDRDPKAEESAYRLNIDDFVIQESTETVLRCPAGHEPVSSEHDPATGKTTTVMPSSACAGCSFSGECPIRRVVGKYKVVHTAKQRRLAARRREEQTEVFRERYRLRAGIEGTNSGLKRRTGLGRLRVRGRPRVFNAILLKLAGWNILRAAVSAAMRKIVAQRAISAAPAAFLAMFSLIFGSRRSSQCSWLAIPAFRAPAPAFRQQAASA